jgi:hypothetical protein
MGRRCLGGCADGTALMGCPSAQTSLLLPWRASGLERPNAIHRHLISPGRLDVLVRLLDLPREGAEHADQ